jgi:hypothetical protein
MPERVVFSDFSFLFFFNVSFVYSRSFRELALMNPYIYTLKPLSFLGMNRTDVPITAFKGHIKPYIRYSQIYLQSASFSSSDIL